MMHVTNAVCFCFLFFGGAFSWLDERMCQQHHLTRDALQTRMPFFHLFPPRLGCAAVHVCVVIREYSPRQLCSIVSKRSTVLNAAPSQDHSTPSSWPFFFDGPLTFLLFCFSQFSHIVATLPRRLHIITGTLDLSRQTARSAIRIIPFYQLLSTKINTRRVFVGA